MSALRLGGALALAAALGAAAQDVSGGHGTLYMTSRPGKLLIVD